MYTEHPPEDWPDDPPETDDELADCTIAMVIFAGATLSLWITLYAVYVLLGT